MAEPTLDRPYQAKTNGSPWNHDGLAGTMIIVIDSDKNSRGSTRRASHVERGSASCPRKASHSLRLR